jgi:hypothetical protein
MCIWDRLVLLPILRNTLRRKIDCEMYIKDKAIFDIRPDLLSFKRLARRCLVCYIYFVK